MSDPNSSEQAPREPSSLEQLLEKLKRHEWTTNWRAADALAHVGPEAVPWLLQALESEDGYMRNGAAIALGKIGSQHFVQPLLRALRWNDDRVYEDDEDIEARMSAATALGKIHDPAVCEPLLSELDKVLEANPTLASYIVKALGEIGNPKAIPALARLVEHRDPEIQRDASCALAQLGPDAIQILNDILKDRSRQGRRYAVRGLCRKAIPSSIPFLLEILANPDDDKYVRGEAARGLGRNYKSSDIYPALVKILQNERDEIRSSALIALAYLRNSAAFDLIVEQLRDSELRYTAVIALGDLGDTRACALLIPMLKSGDYSLAHHAARALGKIGCVEAIPTLVGFLDGLKDSPIAGAERTVVEEALRMLQGSDKNRH
jgi:HEAT repeat protein